LQPEDFNGNDFYVAALLSRDVALPGCVPLKIQCA
jgi:hypothetical protein